MPAVPLLDQRERPLRSLRLSVTDRCNMRCAYCMPEENYEWLPRPNILHYGEFTELTKIFAAHGVSRLRLTGGEPLLRRDLFRLVEQLKTIDGIDDIALTTNGLRLRDHVRDLKNAGLDRLTISLDTLNPERFRKLTRRDGLHRVIAGIDTAVETKFTGSKLNTVVMRGVNDSEVIALLEFCKQRDIEIRFIEYMDVGGASNWQPKLVISKAEIIGMLQEQFGEITPIVKSDSAPANQFSLKDGYKFGIIASTTEPFCHACDRSRITADGQWYQCLYSQFGTNLRDLLRNDKLDEIHATLKHVWAKRDIQSAVDLAQKNLEDRTAQETDPDAPHHGMHTKGG